MCGPYDWFFNRADPKFRIFLAVLLHIAGWVFFLLGCVYLNNGQIATAGAAVMLLVGLGLGAIQGGAVVYRCCGPCGGTTNYGTY